VTLLVEVILLKARISHWLYVVAKMMQDPSTAARSEAKLEHMLKVGQEKLKQGAAGAMEEAMAAMTDPQVMAEMAQMMKDPKFQERLAAMTKDPSFKNYVAAVS
jgi:hypothetical protein